MYLVGVIKSANDVADLDLRSSSPVPFAEIMSRLCILGRAAAGREEDLGKYRGFPDVNVEGVRACAARVRLAMSLRSFGDTIAMVSCSAASRRAAARVSTAVLLLYLLLISHYYNCI